MDIFVYVNQHFYLFSSSRNYCEFENRNLFVQKLVRGMTNQTLKNPFCDEQTFRVFIFIC